MMIKYLMTIAAVAATASAIAAPQSMRDIEKEGERDGRKYASDLRHRGITPDGTACAVGMAAEDARRPHYTQTQIERYAAAFGNACIGRKVL